MTKLIKMKTNKILLGGIAGAVTFFLLGWLIFGLLLLDFSTANFDQSIMRPMEEMIWWGMILSHLASGFLLSIVFSLSNIKGIMAGAKVGGILGLLISIGIDLGIYAQTNIFLNLSVVSVDIIANTVMAAIAGVVVALVMDMGKKEA